MRAYNSTIRVKKKACVRCGKEDFIFSRGRCATCSKIEDTLARDEKATEEMIKEEDLSDLISDADTVFSQYIRLKYANERGMVKCYTCDDLKHWTMVQNGHYISRSHLYLRWDERNCRPQCRNCNEFHHGNIAIYRERLDKESQGLPEYLYDDMKIIHKPTRAELKQLVADYAPKVKELKKRLL